MRVRLEGKTQEITLEGPLVGRGGEASIYAVPGRQDIAAKIYHNPSDEHAAKLAAMLAAPPVPPPQAGQYVTLAWPISRLLESPPSSPPNLGGELRSSPPKLGGDEGGGRVIGYLMPRIDKVHLIWEIYNPGVRREICPHFHHGLLLRTARNLAAAVHSLHECGYVVGDLNESNVLITKQASVALIDVDSFQVPGRDRLYRCRVGRPEYTAPELQGVTFADVDRLPQHDAFALAVLIFQLLMQGIHPFAGTCISNGEPDSIAVRIAAGHWPYGWLRTGPIQPTPHAPPWSALPPSVQELLRRCFEDAQEEPDLRPSAAEWQNALEEAELQLTTCRHSSQHVYHRQLDRCPWCGPSSLILSSPPACHTEIPERKVEGKRRRVVNDPLPPRQAEVDVILVAQAPVAGGAELILQAIGIALEQNKWLMWVGVALIGAVAGVIYALQHAL